mgnify:CR=1 FL=1
MNYKLLIGIAIVLTTFYALTNYTFNKVVNEAKNSRIRASQADPLEKYLKDDVELVSKDNLKLRGTYIPYLRKTAEAEKTIILIHGYTATSESMADLITPFLSHGWNVMLIDQRGHGKSEGQYASFGYHEKGDLDLWVNWVRDRSEKKHQVIGLLGISMGAGTVLEYAGINKHVNFIIADCPYSDLEELLKYQIREIRNIPAYPLINALDLMLRIRVDFNIKAVSPLKTVRESEIPIMFIHGSEDRFVPTQMSKDLYAIKKGKKKLLIVEGASHANSYWTNKNLYEKEVWDFIDEVLTTVTYPD